MNKKQEEVSTMILDYLRENPDAGDTLEGISGWWLECERIDMSVDEVSKVLAELVEKGLIKKVKLGNSKYVYKITK